MHRIQGELGAEEAAELYDRELDGITLDLALNGIGSDGHTASLFPGAPALAEQERRAVAAEPGLEPFVERVTLTPPVFAATRLLVYLVTGESKAEAVRRAFAEEPSADTPGEPDPRRRDDRDPRPRRRSPALRSGLCLSDTSSSPIASSSRCEGALVSIRHKVRLTGSGAGPSTSGTSRPRRWRLRATRR